MSDISRLQAFLRATAAPNREVVELPPFTAYFNADDPLRYLNYAIPADGAEPSSDEIDRLRRAFRERDGLPRLEWIEEAAPLVAAALSTAGMAEELNAPLMACSPDDLIDAKTNVPELTVAPVGEEDRRACANVQRAAFGEAPLPEDQEPPRFGGGAVLARSARESVSAASWTRVIDGLSEVAGVATAEEWRGRGLAGVVTAAATRAAFAAGATLCVLSPGNEAAQRVYERAGFKRVATMLHWSDPG